MTKLQIKVTAEQIQRAFAGETVELIPAIAGHSMTIHDIDRVGNIVTVSFHPEPMTTPEPSPLEPLTAEELDALTVPQEMRMNAYHFGFSKTGVTAIDRILSAVAQAGKGYHYTADWPDGGYPEMIQGAADDATKLILRLIAQARAARPSPWQDISTAPKDRAILVAFKLGREWAIGTAHWQEFSDDSRGWIGSSFWSESGQSWGTVTDPIYWQEHPAKPAPPAQDGGRP